MSDFVNSRFMQEFDRGKGEAFTFVRNVMEVYRQSVLSGAPIYTEQELKHRLGLARELIKDSMDREMAWFGKQLGVSPALVEFECDAIHQELAALLDGLVTEATTEGSTNV